jgi:hypothetical protein
VIRKHEALQATLALDVCITVFGSATNVNIYNVRVSLAHLTDGKRPDSHFRENYVCDVGVDIDTSRFEIRIDDPEQFV